MSLISNPQTISPHAPLPSKPSFSFLPVVVLVIGIIVAGTLLGSPAGERGALALISGVFLFVFLNYSPQAGMPLVLTFLCLLGGIRRWLIPMLGWPDSDPLLLTVPVVVIVSVINLALQRRISYDTKLSKQLLWLLGIMTAEIFNPLQGGLMVGLMGSLFFIVPILWYYVGRSVGTELLLTRVFGVVIAISIAAALYGLYQTWFGFTDSEKQWLTITAQFNGAMDVMGTTRPFSFFTSPEEYGQFLAFGVVIITAGLLRENRSRLILLPILGLAVFLASQRNVIVFLLTTCIVLWAIQGKTAVSWIPRCVLAAVVGALGLVWSLQQSQNTQYDAQTQALIQHQTEGLLDPMNSNHSTAQLHTVMFWSGIATGFTNPLGRGLGATNLAGTKYGTSDDANAIDSHDTSNGSSEVDLSNTFTSLGVIGGLLYLSIKILVLQRAFRFWYLSRSYIALSILAILLVSIRQWISMGHYAGFTLDWFCIGALDRLFVDWQRKHQPPLLSQPQLLAKIVASKD